MNGGSFLFCLSLSLFLFLSFSLLVPLFSPLTLFTTSCCYYCYFLSCSRFLFSVGRFVSPHLLVSSREKKSMSDWPPLFYLVLVVTGAHAEITALSLNYNQLHDGSLTCSKRRRRKAKEKKRWKRNPRKDIENPYNFCQKSSGFLCFLSHYCLSIRMIDRAFHFITEPVIIDPN